MAELSDVRVGIQIYWICDSNILINYPNKYISTSHFRVYNLAISSLQRREISDARLCLAKAINASIVTG